MISQAKQDGSLLADFLLACAGKSWNDDSVLYQQVIVTGASSGLGAAFARRLADACECLVLVARREGALQALADELRGQHPSLEVRVEPCDLANPAARAALIERLPEFFSFRDVSPSQAVSPSRNAPASHTVSSSRVVSPSQAVSPTRSSSPDRPVSPARTLLINNAGLGDYGDILTSEESRNRQMMQVNMEALVELSRALLPRLTAQGGAIINIASLAAELPIPDFAVYAASKAFVASFSEALRLELRSYGVPVLAVCPGPVHTGFGEAARRSGCSGDGSPFKKWFYTPVDTVVEASLKALERDRPRCYPSLRIALSAAFIRLLPRFLLRRVMSLRPRRTHSLSSSSRS